MGEAFPMNGGDGAYSYTKNSKYQKLGSDSAKEMIQEAVIENLDTAEILKSISNTVSIADMGCSVGPNTFFTVENLIEAVEHKVSPSSKNDVEFQVFFNDHSANDFNTLFASLPAERQYHAAGVPGSFHGRLFPRASIALAHSSYALQWLSKQPHLGLLVPNEGRVHYLGAPHHVLRAYSHQYERDLGGFISARAEEIVSGGLMLLVVSATPDSHDGLSRSETLTSVLYSYLGISLMELANEGVVDKAKIDAFNLPLFDPTAGEMRKVIERNGCFSIERMDLMYPFSQIKTEINVGSMIVNLRAAIEGILTAHFGNYVVVKMFGNMLAKTQEISERLEAADHTQLFVVLKRK